MQTMSNSLMSLETFSFLLQHMDANKRFEIRQRCPSLREFERNVPLKIKSLVKTGSSVKVNDTTYKIGIIRKCNVGQAPKHVAEKNETGGDPYEVDGYGIKDESDALLVTPGDVVTNQRSEQFMRNEDMHDGHLEELVRVCEEELANLRERRPSRRNLEKIHQIEKTIADSRARLLEYQSRRENIPSKYELFFQLTKSRTVDKKEQKTIQRYTHNKKFSEAIKHLATVLLGGRCSPIYVTKLQCLCSRIIRLPVGLQLKVEQLVFRADLGTSVGVLAPILHENSYPLKKLDVEFLSDGDAANPIVNTAGILRIRLVFRNHLQTMSAITNPVVHLAMAVLHGPSALLEELVEHWIESKRPVGYKYIFYLHQEPVFAFEMEDILKKLNGVPVDDENVVIPMSENTQLKVSYGPFPEFAPRSKWAVKFLTEAVEH